MENKAAGTMVFTPGLFFEPRDDVSAEGNLTPRPGGDEAAGKEGTSWGGKNPGGAASTPRRRRYLSSEK